MQSETLEEESQNLEIGRCCLEPFSLSAQNIQPLALSKSSDMNGLLRLWLGSKSSETVLVSLV